MSFIGWILIVLAVIVGLWLFFAFATNDAKASHGNDNSSVRYDRVSGDHPTVIQKIVVKGSGCMNAEDSVDLRLLEYVPVENKAVYHCIIP